MADARFPEPWGEPPTYGIPDPQQADPICDCTQCGMEIYPGDKVYTDTPDAPGAPDSVTVHEGCLLDWVCEQGVPAVADAFGFSEIGGDT